VLFIDISQIKYEEKALNFTLKEEQEGEEKEIGVVL